MSKKRGVGWRTPSSSRYSRSCRRSSEYKAFADLDGLMSYGASMAEKWRRAAYYADRILKGAKRAELPVELPTKVELVVNRKTAIAFGVAIPQSLLVRADEVIQ